MAFSLLPHRHPVPAPLPPLPSIVRLERLNGFHVMVIEGTSASFNNTSPIIANDFSEKEERGIQGRLLCQLLLGSWGE